MEVNTLNFKFRVCTGQQYSFGSLHLTYIYLKLYTRIESGIQKSEYKYREASQERTKCLWHT